MVYESFTHVEHIKIEGFGTVLDSYGNRQRVRIYSLDADRETAEKINFVNLGYKDAVKNVFGPWAHSQIKS